MMMIHGLTVCVGYAEFLARGIARWHAGLATLTIVTAPGDEATVALAREHDARVVVTDLFYRDGAAFNKGRAMEHARQSMPWTDWVLFFDSDVVPPANWSDRLASAGLAPGLLYGAYRYEAQDGDIDDRGQSRMTHDVPGVGYFQLFHVSDPAVQVRDGQPVIDTHWVHGGNYDNRFMDRWRNLGSRVREVPFRLAHVGERENWFGRGNRQAFLDMKSERQRRGGRWDHECIAPAS